jgi:GNAT superfamily N-acetyltransferase
VQIRQAVPEDSAGIARVHVNSWRTTYPGIVSHAVLEKLSVERSQEFWQKVITDPEERSFILVAVDGQGGVVGFASAGPERSGNFPYQSELYAIYMLKAYQGRGVGRQLVLAVAHQLLKQGLSSMLVWVLRDNLFRAFYEALGGEQIGEKDITIGDETLVEVAYGWEDIHPLVSEG